MAFRSRPLAILASIGFLLVGFATWAATGTLVDGDAEQGGGGILVALWAGAAVLAVLAWRLPDPRAAVDGASTEIGDVASWIIPAVVGPLALYPLALTPSDGATAVLAVLWPLSTLPLALALGGLMGRHRLAARGFSIVAAVVAGGLGLLPLVTREVAPGQPEIQFLAVWAIAGVPATILLATPRFGVTGSETFSSSQVTDQVTFAVAGLAPALGAAIFILPWGTGLVALVVAMGAFALVGRFAVRPLAWVAARANAQRDLAVAVSESERRRLAADLHDGPLQNVLLLARRLDLAGDLEGANLARGIGDELRELAGDLQLPLLDDLGVGPALDWLAGRVQRMTGVEVRVESEADGRVPHDVELAAFRIAQEAIANAVRHGQPPVVVRCRTDAAHLSLSIDDAGDGLARSAGARTNGPARYGILNMQQRADQVGATLELRRPRTGGTQVALEWPASAG